MWYGALQIVSILAPKITSSKGHAHGHPNTHGPNGELTLSFIWATWKRFHWKDYSVGLLGWDWQSLPSLVVLVQFELFGHSSFWVWFLFGASYSLAKPRIKAGWDPKAPWKLPTNWHNNAQLLHNLPVPNLSILCRLFSFVLVCYRFLFFAQCTLAPGALFEAPSRKQPSRNCLQGHDRYGQGRETSVNSRLQCSKCYSNVWYICFIMFPCSNKVPPPVKTLHHLHTVLCRFSFFQLRDSCLYETLFKSFQVFHMCSITSGTLAQRPRGLFLHWSKTGCMAIPRVCD